MKALMALAIGTIALGSALFGLANGDARQDDGKTTTGEPVLLELFTSQGCSSCPPADRLAAQLARSKDFVVVSRPVTYWDRLGWKDTLAREENTALQRAYAKSGLGGSNGVYTPQIAVDGRYGAVGSDKSAILRLAANARGKQAAAIRVKPQPDGAIAVGLGGATGKPAELVLLGLAGRKTVTIARGENGGKQVDYVNVVRSEAKLADWSGGKQRIVVPARALATPGADRYALILREPGGGPVLAAQLVR